MSSDTALSIVAPKGYIRGMAVMFGRVYCKMNANRDAASEMATADSGDDSVDALTWYAPEFSQLGMDNSAPGVDVLRHLFVLLTGLGMRESSGRHCEGRDMDAGNTGADTAEAGLFQEAGIPAVICGPETTSSGPSASDGKAWPAAPIPGRTGAPARAPISRR